MLAAGPRTVPALGTRFLERTRAAALIVQVDRVTDAVQNPFLFPMWVYAAGLTAVATLYVVTSEYTQSLELHPFDVLYGVAFSVAVLLLLLTCGRMVLVWTRLRAALRDHRSASRAVYVRNHASRGQLGTNPTSWDRP